MGNETKIFHFISLFRVGGRKKAKDAKVVPKKKRGSSSDEARPESGGKTQKANKKQKVIHEKESRKTQKVNHFHFIYQLNSSTRRATK